MAIGVDSPSRLANRVAVNGIHGSIDDEQIGLLNPSSKDAPLSELQESLDRDGYLYVKQLIPRQDVLKMRRRYFEQFQDLGMLKDGTDPELGLFDLTQDPGDHAGIGAGLSPGKQATQQAMADAHLEPDYLKFLDHPSLRQFVRDLMGWKGDTLLKRTMLRHNIPGGMSTGVHYDKLFLRAGGAYFLTAWVPIGDISQNGGGLFYLSGSKELGRDLEAEFATNAKDLPENERLSAFNVQMGEFGYLSKDAGQFHREQAAGKGRWLVSDFEAGDVVFHDPYIIHGSSRNEDEKGRIRLSTDLRFYEQGSDIDKRWHRDFWRPKDGL